VLSLTLPGSLVCNLAVASEFTWTSFEFLWWPFCFLTFPLAEAVAMALVFMLVLFFAFTLALVLSEIWADPFVFTRLSEVFRPARSVVEVETLERPRPKLLSPREPPPIPPRSWAHAGVVNASASTKAEDIVWIDLFMAAVPPHKASDVMGNGKRYAKVSESWVLSP
jgi:hypothetical protein